MLPCVRSVRAKSDFQLEITFTRGEVGIYDCRPLLDFGVFRELKDEAYFILPPGSCSKWHSRLAARAGYLPRHVVPRFSPGTVGPKVSKQGRNS